MRGVKRARDMVLLKSPKLQDGLAFPPHFQQLCADPPAPKRRRDVKVVQPAIMSGDELCNHIVLPCHPNIFAQGDICEKDGILGGAVSIG